MQIELYKNVVGFEGFYEISNAGNIRATEKIKNNQYGEFILPTKILSPKNNGRGYLAICLIKNKIKTTHKIHRIVAMAFMSNFNKDLQVNHINGIKTDNRIENLELCSNRENGTHKFLSKSKTSKYVGISFCKGRNKWQSCIQVNGKSIFLGRFKTELEAADAYRIYLSKNNIKNKYAAA